MNPASDLSSLAEKFSARLLKLHAEAVNDQTRVDQYCIIAISQLNNFLRAYLLSLRTGALDSSGTRAGLAQNFATEADLIDAMVRIGHPGKWRPGNVGIWMQKDEPALHTPTIFLRVANGLGCSNIATITAAMTDSWKVDVLRSVRNYFSHRCVSTERVAIQSVATRYSVGHRAAKILLERDPNIAQRVIDDIQIYLSDFARDIT